MRAEADEKQHHFSVSFLHQHLASSNSRWSWAKDAKRIDTEMQLKFETFFILKRLFKQRDTTFVRNKRERAAPASNPSQNFRCLEYTDFGCSRIFEVYKWPRPSAFVFLWKMSGHFEQEKESCIAWAWTIKNKIRRKSKENSADVGPGFSWRKFGKELKYAIFSLSRSDLISVSIKMVFIKSGFPHLDKSFVKILN